MSIIDDQQRSVLYAQHKLAREGKICDQLRPLFDTGWSFEEIAEALLKGDIRNSIQKYQTENKLTPNGGSQRLYDYSMLEKFFCFQGGSDGLICFLKRFLSIYFLPSMPMTEFACHF